MAKQEYNLDVEGLRRDLKDRFGTAIHSGFPMAVVDLSKAERATPQELLEMAQEQGLDIRDYLE